MNKSINILIIIALIGAVIYLVLGIVSYNRMESKVLDDGVFFNGIINSHFIGRQSVRSFTCRFKVRDTTHIKEFDVNKDYFNMHQIGDTIIIKLLPSTPDKSIIIEDKEYKSCMGLPPKDGWKELPSCN